MKSRISYVDVEHCRQVIDNAESHILRLSQKIEKEPRKLPQQRYNSLAEDHYRIGNFKYAIGVQIETCMKHWVHAIEFKSRAIQYRGTEGAFPYYEVAVEQSNANMLENDMNIDKMSQDKIDYSMNNSWDTFRFCCLAKLTRNSSAFDSLAAAIWDPEDADYIEGRYEVLTMGQKQIAYQFRELITGAPCDYGQSNSAGKELSGLALMINGLANDNKKDFNHGIKSHLEWHTLEARKKMHQYRSSYYIAIEAIGLAIIASERKLAMRGEFSQHEGMYFPQELLDYAQSAG